MFRRLSAIILMAAWLCASGALLQIAQVYAWTRMFSGYVQCCGLEDAAVRTFDPAHPCAICRAIERAAEQRSRHDAPNAQDLASVKLLLVCETTDTVVPPRDMPGWATAETAALPGPVREVAVPPPRVAELNA